MYRGLFTIMTWTNLRVHLILRICKWSTACYGRHSNACPVTGDVLILSTALYKQDSLVIWYPITRTHKVLHQGHPRAQIRFAQFYKTAISVPIR